MWLRCSKLFDDWVCSDILLPLISASGGIQIICRLNGSVQIRRSGMGVQFLTNVTITDLLAPCRPTGRDLIHRRGLAVTQLVLTRLHCMSFPFHLPVGSTIVSSHMVGCSKVVKLVSRHTVRWILIYRISCPILINARSSPSLRRPFLGQSGSSHLPAARVF